MQQLPYQLSEQLTEQLEQAVNEFRKLDDSPIRIITHLDADGLSSAAILAKAFQGEKKKFAISAVKQLDENKIREFARENYKTIFFIDLGSGYLNLIEETLSKKKIFILDHHIPDKKSAREDIIHINPHLFESKEDALNLSGSGVVYLFAKKLNSKNKALAHISLIGTIGDLHDLKGPTQEIIDDSVASGEIEITTGLRMFGTQTKPIINILRYSTDPYIPGVTGSEQGTLAFLKEVGIESQKNGKPIRIIDLEEEQKKKLVTGIILKRMGSEKDPEDILGTIYLLKKEPEGSPTKDIKEFATLLNACGRLEKASIGIATCMGSETAKSKALQVLQDYKQELISTMNWFHQNKENPISVMERGGLVLINAEDKIKDTMIGTLASILANSNIYPESTILISMAQTIDEKTKISIRIVNGKNSKKKDVREIIGSILKKIGEGISGGHSSASGALIPQEKEKAFISAALEMFK